MHLYFDVLLLFCCCFVRFSLPLVALILFSFLGLRSVISLIFLAGEISWILLGGGGGGGVVVVVICNIFWPCLVLFLCYVVCVCVPLVCVVTVVAVLCLFVSFSLFYHILFSLVIVYLLCHIFSFAVFILFVSFCYVIFPLIRFTMCSVCVCVSSTLFTQLSSSSMKMIRKRSLVFLVETLLFSFSLLGTFLWFVFFSLAWNTQYRVSERSFSYVNYYICTAES